MATSRQEFRGRSGHSCGSAPAVSLLSVQIKLNESKFAEQK